MKTSGEFDDVRGRLGTLSRAILAAYFVVALALIYWGVVRGPSILTRLDNPRVVEEELRVRRGSILDTNDVVLAESVAQVENLARLYPIPAVGPAVGFYSIRHGTAGIEDTFDATLRGSSENFWTDYWRYDALHEPQIGRDVRLTLDARWQEAASTLLKGQNGAVLLFSVPDMAIRAMVSHPDFDPNKLEEEFDDLLADKDAPLLNRVTQGQYQPGLVLQPFLMAAALDEGLISLDDVAEDSSRTIQISGTELHCAKAAQEPLSWAEALQLRCPGAMASLGTMLGEVGLQNAFSEFGFLSVPELPVAAEAATDSTIANPVEAAVGQGELTLSPMQVGIALASLANDGQFSQAQLVQAVQDQDGDWQPLPKSGTVEVTTLEAAQQILSALTSDDGLIEHSALALSGPGGNTNGWYMGLAPASAPRYGVVVVVEDASNTEAAQKVGSSLLKEVLNPNGHE